LKDWEKTIIPKTATIKEAIERIDKSGMQIAIIVGDRNKLLGIVTDGDVRRGILRGLSLDESVQEIMNRKPKFVYEHDNWKTSYEVFQKKNLHHIPILNKDGCVKGIRFLDELVHKKHKNNWVFIMAGGIGSRLSPLTDNKPKPLLEVGNKPLLETILENFIEQGFKQFYISVNYKAEMIESHFGNGSNLGVTIEYIREIERKGTAGALSLLNESPKSPLIVMNGDIVTKVDFHQLLDFHTDYFSKATMCVREYDFQVPFGVAKLNQQKIVDIDEKPIHRFFVNAGIYVLEPEVLSMIPQNCFYDMTNLFSKLIQKEKEIAAFPIREYWMDIGHIGDYNKVNGEFNEVFE
jgi:dTDP-glucose pyrophosphorylase